MFEVVGVSAKGGVEVFTYHDAGFQGMCLVGGFYELVYLLKGVLVFLYPENLCCPSEIIFYCGDVGSDCVVDFIVKAILGGKNDKEVCLVFCNECVIQSCFLRMG